MPKDGIGASPKRREDVRFLTGAGNYTDDINIRGQAYVYFLRSDIAHGKINKIDTSDAEAMPGVVRIFTGKDFEGIGGLPCGWQVRRKMSRLCPASAGRCAGSRAAPDQRAVSAISSGDRTPRPIRRGRTCSRIGQQAGST